MKFKEIISGYPKKQRDFLIPMLQDIQKAYGFLPGEALAEMANHLELPLVKIYSVATYYNQFQFDSRGKWHIQVCDGSGCHLEGNRRVLAHLSRLLDIQEGEMTSDQMFSLELVPCLGACHLAPLMRVNGKLYGKTDVRDLGIFIDQLRLSGDEPGK